MPATHHIDNQAKLIITTWDGDAVDTELIETINAYQSEIQVNPEYIDYNEVVNFSAVKSIRLTPQGIKNIGNIAAKTDDYKENSKLALIVSSNIAFNFARMYASYRQAQNRSSKEIRIFKNEPDALEWAQRPS